jgi:hypothetical protein
MVRLELNKTGCAYQNSLKCSYNCCRETKLCVLKPMMAKICHQSRICRTGQRQYQLACTRSCVPVHFNTTQKVCTHVQRTALCTVAAAAFSASVTASSACAALKLALYSAMPYRRSDFLLVPVALMVVTLVAPGLSCDLCDHVQSASRKQ